MNFCVIDRDSFEDHNMIEKTKVITSLPFFPYPLIQFKNHVL